MSALEIGKLLAQFASVCAGVYIGWRLSERSKTRERLRMAYGDWAAALAEAFQLDSRFLTARLQSAKAPGDRHWTDLSDQLLGPALDSHRAVRGAWARLMVLETSRHRRAIVKTISEGLLLTHSSVAGSDQVGALEHLIDGRRRAFTYQNMFIEDLAIRDDAWWRRQYRTLDLVKAAEREVQRSPLDKYLTPELIQLGFQAEKRVQAEQRPHRPQQGSELAAGTPSDHFSPRASKAGGTDSGS